MSIEKRVQDPIYHWVVIKDDRTCSNRKIIKDELVSRVFVLTTKIISLQHLYVLKCLKPFIKVKIFYIIKVTYICSLQSLTFSLSYLKSKNEADTGDSILKRQIMLISPEAFAICRCECVVTIETTYHNKSININLSCN